jgi:hypothetical protein
MQNLLHLWLIIHASPLVKAAVDAEVDSGYAAVEGQFQA